MICEQFQILCDYNCWAHHQVWECILLLSEEQFTAVDDGFGMSVHEQVVHTLNVEWLWAARLRGMSPTSTLTVAMLPTRDAIRLKWDEVESDLRQYVSRLREIQLNEPITYTTTAGETQRNTRWEILAHVFNHSTEHRSRILAMLIHMGAQTAPQDLLKYFHETQQRRREPARQLRS